MILSRIFGRRNVRDSQNHARPRRCPQVEGLEGRQLLSTVTPAIVGNHIGFSAEIVGNHIGMSAGIVGQHIGMSAGIVGQHIG